MKKVSELQTFLTVTFVACLLISNVITSRQMQLPFGITAGGGLFVFPITYVLSDVFSECYGYRWSRVTCYLAFAMNLLMVLMSTVVINMPAPSYWDGAEAFSRVLGNTPRVLAGSLLGFVMGDWVNDKVFRLMKASHPDEMDGFGVRAILSSLVGEIVDSLFFFPIAFWGQMPVETLFVMAFVNIGLKMVYETMILPITTQVAKRVNAYEAN